MIPTPTRNGNKIEGDFYPLQKAELIALHRSKIINNAAFVHFALRYENPFCDRPLTLLIKEFALRWGMSENSAYKALAKLKSVGIIKFNSGKVTIEWESETRQKNTAIPKKNSQNGKKLSDQQMDLPNGKKLSDQQMDLPNGKKIVGSANELSDQQKNCQNGKNQPPECPSDNDPEPSQTLQTNQTSQTIQNGMEGVENSGSDPDLDLVNKEIPELEQNCSRQTEDSQEEKPVSKEDPNQDQSSATVVQDTTKRCTNQPTVIQDTTKRCTKSEEIVETLHATSLQKVEVSSNGNASNVCKIPQDLINKLEELHIPLDEKVRKAIADHHISQAYGAMRHVENTWESINNPRSVFLHQLPLQRVQKGQKPLSEEFLQWYQWAIADGLVVERPPEHLPKNFRGEPRVTLVIDHYWLEDWEKVRDNPDDYRQKIDPSLHKKLLAQVKNVFKKMPDAEPEFTLNDKLKDHILGPEVYQQIKHTHDIEFTEEGQPYQATEIIEIEYDEDGFPVEEVKQC